MQGEANTSAVARRTARHNVVAGVVLVAVAAFLFWQSFSISLDFVDEEGIGPRFFPQAICFALGVLGLLMAALGLKGQVAPADSTSFSATRFWQDAVPLFLLALAFIWGFKAFGYFTATLFLIAAGLLVFAVRGRALFLMPLIAATALYLIFFRLMRVYEPTATIVNPLSLLGLN